MFVSKTWYKEVTILTVISFAIEFAVGFVIGLALVSVDQVYLFQTDIFAIYEAIIAVVIFTGLAIWRIRKKTVTVKGGRALLLKQEHEISKIINVLIPFVVSMTQMAMTILRPTVVSQLDYSAVSIR